MRRFPRAIFFNCARDALYEKPRRIGRAALLQAQRPRVAARVISTTH
jgi:hypothetical protein